MIIFDNNKNRKRINSAKGIKPMAFFLYVKTYLNIYKLFVVVIMGGIDIIFKNTTKYDKISVEKI